jgi:hypothetical protein
MARTVSSVHFRRSGFPRTIVARFLTKTGSSFGGGNTSCWNFQRELAYFPKEQMQGGRIEGSDGCGSKD